jgi:hypothetical protein
VKVSWYTRAQGKKVLVAAGTANSSKASNVVVKIRLNGAGRRQLKPSRRTTILQADSFVLAGGAAMTVTNKITLRP